VDRSGALKNEMEQLFDRFFEPGDGESFAMGEWAPRLDLSENKDEKFYRVERTYGSFTRSVRLPAPVDENKVTATFKNGLLTVMLPKTPAARSTAIPIKTG
jgi:hypothetical protein